MGIGKEGNNMEFVWARGECASTKACLSKASDAVNYNPAKKWNFSPTSNKVIPQDKKLSVDNGKFLFAVSKLQNFQAIFHNDWWYFKCLYFQAIHRVRPEEK